MDYSEIFEKVYTAVENEDLELIALLQKKYGDSEIRNLQLIISAGLHNNDGKSLKSLNIF